MEVFNEQLVFAIFWGFGLSFIVTMITAGVVMIYDMLSGRKPKL